MATLEPLWHDTDETCDPISDDTLWERKNEDQGRRGKGCIGPKNEDLATDVVPELTSKETTPVPLSASSKLSEATQNGDALTEAGRMHSKVSFDPVSPVELAGRLESQKDTTLVPQKASTQLPVAPEATKFVSPKVLTELDALPTRSKTRETALVAATTATTKEDLYAVSEPVPGSKKKKRVYPRAPVVSDCWSSLEYQERFEVVKDQLQKTVNEDVKLRDKIKTPILYRLQMVGKTPADAVPSIVIMWDDSKHMKSLQSLFSGAQYSLHCGGKRSLTGRFINNQPKHIPPLKLVYVLNQRGSIIRMALPGVQLKAFFENDITYCGGLVEYQGSSATLAMSIQIDNDSAFLTVDHIFPPCLVIDSQASFNQALSVSTPPDESIDGNKEVESSELLWESDDDEYEYGNQDDHGVGSSEGELPEIDSLEAEKGFFKRDEDWEVVSPPLKLDPALPYLDWSLVRPLSPSLDKWQTNLFFLDGPNASPTSVHAFRSRPRHHLALVTMVSGIRGAQPGRILANTGFLANLPGQKDCEVLTVILDAPEGLVHGECGSIVIDQETTEVYGHVVGCDPTGHALVVPLEQVLSQVKATFSASYVSISRSFSGGPLPKASPDSSAMYSRTTGMMSLGWSLTNASTESSAMYSRTSGTMSAVESYYRDYQSDIIPESPETSKDDVVDQPGSGPASHGSKELDQDERITSMTNAAHSLQQTGQYELAIQRYRELLRLQESTLGNDHPDTLVTMEKLGAMMDRVGKFEDALLLNTRTHEIRSKVLGEDHPDTLTSFNSIALVLESQGKYDQAKEMLWNLHKIQTRVLGDEHPALLDTKNNLAVVLNFLEEYDEAEKLSKETLDLRLKVLGESHRDTHTSMNNLMLVLDGQKKYKKAVEMGRQTVALREKALGPEHPDTLISLTNLALVLGNLGNLNEAEKIGRRTLALQKTTCGPEHPDTLTTMNNLAVLLESQGKFEEAWNMGHETLLLRGRVLGPAHPDTIITRENGFMNLISIPKAQKPKR